MLTRDFKETIRARAERDRAFRQALINEAILALQDGDIETARAILENLQKAGE